MNQVEKVIFVTIYTILGFPFLLVVPQELMLHYGMNDIVSILLSMFIFIFVFIGSLIVYAIIKAFYVAISIYAQAYVEASKMNIDEHDNIELRKRLRYA